MLVNVSLSLGTSPCNCLLQRMCFANDGSIQFFGVFHDVEEARLLLSMFYSFHELRALPVLAR